MREIIFDTETTGLDSRADRIIEIGGIELENLFPTGRTLHLYINPDGREIHPDAQAVHGITKEQLAGKPTFAMVAQQIVDFFEGAKFVAHNANFDMGFVNAEFERLGMPPIAPDRVVDTLSLARRRHPMGPNSLDALCKRYGIDNSHRTRHGALLDSELLADVYIEMLGGRQAALGLVAESKTSVTVTETETTIIAIGARPRPLKPRITPEEAAAHEKLVMKLGSKAIWLKAPSQSGAD